MKLLSALLFLLTFSGVARADINCDDLIGIWSNERWDKTLSSERRTVAVLESDGSISIKFIYDDGKDISVREEFGNWTCEGTTLSIAITMFGNKPAYNFSQYKLLGLSSMHQKMSGLNTNCSNSLGDCGDDVIYDYYKVLN